MSDFTKNSPIAGDEILSAHVRNIEDYLAQVVEIIDENSVSTTGVATLRMGNNMGASGDASSGITLYSTASGSDSTAVNMFDAIYSNLYVGLKHSIMFTSQTEVENVYIKARNLPTTGEATFQVNLITSGNVESLVQSGFIMDSSTPMLEEALAASQTFEIGEEIEFEVVTVDEGDVGNPIIFGFSNTG